MLYVYENIQDTEDAVHNAFLKAIETRKQFESENHEKAWLIRVASNICKNMLKAACRKNEPLNNNIPDSNISNEAKELLSELSKLPDKLKIPVYLFYYDGYSSEEIGQMLHISSSAVRTRLQKARERLRNVLGDERSGMTFVDDKAFWAQLGRITYFPVDITTAVNTEIYAADDFDSIFCTDKQVQSEILDLFDSAIDITNKYIIFPILTRQSAYHRI